MDLFKPLVLALQFLTRIPMPDIGVLEQRQVGRSLLWYPLVGGVIGSLLLLTQLLLNQLWPELWSLQAALLLCLWCLITGGLHLDGLADSADAWAGGLGDRQRTLELMKDPRCGPAAVTWVVLLLLVKFAALVALVEQAPGWLLLAPIIGRALLVLLFVTTDYVREQGLGSALAAHCPKGQAQALLAGLALLLLLVSPGVAMLVSVVSGLLFLALRHLMQVRLGGTTGDTAGALVEFGEAVCLLALLSAL